MVRKHNRRAAKAAFAVAIGVALVLGGAAAAPAAPERAEATPIIMGAKNFTEQYVLGEIYAQALEAAGYQVKTDLKLGSEVIAYRALRQGEVDAYPE